MQVSAPNCLVNLYQGWGVPPIWKVFIELMASLGRWKAGLDEKHDANLDAHRFGSRSTDLDVGTQNSMGMV